MITEQQQRVLKARVALVLYAEHRRVSSEGEVEHLDSGQLGLF